MCPQMLLQVCRTRCQRGSWIRFTTMWLAAGWMVAPQRARHDGCRFWMPRSRDSVYHVFPYSSACVSWLGSCCRVACNSDAYRAVTFSKFQYRRWTGPPIRTRRIPRTKMLGSLRGATDDYVETCGVSENCNTKLNVQYPIDSKENRGNWPLRVNLSIIFSTIVVDA